MENYSELGGKSRSWFYTACVGILMLSLLTSGCHANLDPGSTRQSAKSPAIGYNTHLTFNPDGILNPDMFMQTINVMHINGLNSLRFNLIPEEFVAVDGVNKSINFNESHLVALQDLAKKAKEKSVNMQVVISPPNVDDDMYETTASAYVDEVTTRLSGLVDSWQVFNEGDVHKFKTYEEIPTADDEYIADMSNQVESLSSIIRRNDPNALVTINVSRWQGSESLDAFKSRMIKFVPHFIGSIDYITLDLYPDLNQEEIKKIPEIIQFFRDEFGLDVVIGEIGLSTAPGEFTEDQQVSMLLQSIEAATKACPGGINVYELQDELPLGKPEPQNPHEYHFGVGDNPQFINVNEALVQFAANCK